MFNNSNTPHFLGASGRRGSTGSTTSSTSSSPFFPTSILQSNAFNTNQQINNSRGTPPILATGYYFHQYQKQMEQNKSSRTTSPSLTRQSPQELATTLYKTSTVTGEKEFITNQNNFSMGNIKQSTSTFHTDLPNSNQSTNSQHFIDRQYSENHMKQNSILTAINSSASKTNNNSRPTIPNQQEQHLQHFSSQGLFSTQTSTPPDSHTNITNSANSNISPFGDLENEHQCQMRDIIEQGNSNTSLNASGQSNIQSKTTKKLSEVTPTLQANFQNKQIVSPSVPGVVHSYTNKNNNNNNNERTSSNCRKQIVSPENSSTITTGSKSFVSLIEVVGEQEKHFSNNNSTSATSNFGVANIVGIQQGNKLKTSSPTLPNNNYTIIPNQEPAEENLGENYLLTSTSRKQSAGIVTSSKEANKHRKIMSVSTAKSNNNMMMNPPSTISSSPTKTSPHLTSPLKSNVGFSSMKPPSSTSSSIQPSSSPNNTRKLDIPLNDNSNTSSHNPPNTSSSSNGNNTPPPKIPALESEPPTVKLPSIYSILLNNKDPYLSQGKDQNSEIIYLRPIAKMVENSKKKQSCYAHFGNNIVKKQSSLRSKIRGIVGSRRMEEFKKQTTSERANSRTSNTEENDKKDQSSENNLTVDVKTSSSDFNLDINDDTNIIAFGSSEDFGLMYDDVMAMDDQDFISMMNDENLGLLSDQTNVSTPLQEPMRRTSSSMKHEVSHTSLSSFLSSPATPMSNLQTSNQSKDSQTTPTNQNVQNNLWDNPSMNSSFDIPVSSVNFFVPSTVKGSSAASSTNNVNIAPRVVPEVKKPQNDASINSMSNNFAGNRVNPQNNIQSNQMVNKVPNTSMNFNPNTMNSNMNMVNNVNMGNLSSSSSMNTNNMNSNNMGTTNMNKSINNNLGMNNQQIPNIPNNNLFPNNNMNMNNMNNMNNIQNESSNFDTNNFFNISTDTLLQGILYAQKSGINLASLFALTLQQQQNQASSYNESSNFGNFSKNQNQFNNMNSGNMFNNNGNMFSNMGSEIFPSGSNQINTFQNNPQNQFQKSQDNTSQLLLQKLLDSNQLNSSNVQSSFSSRQSNDNTMFNSMNNNLNSQIDSLMMNKSHNSNNNMLNIQNNNNQMLYNQLNNQQVSKFNQQISSPPQNQQQLNSPRQPNQQSNNPLMTSTMNSNSNMNPNNRFIKTENDLNVSMNSGPNWKESYEEPEVVSLSTPRAVGSKTETKRIKIKQDTQVLPISSPPSTQVSSHHDDSSHEEDDESVSSNPQSPDKTGKKKRKSHVTASQVGIVELENNEGFECSYCLRKFKRKSDIKVHIRRHTGERPYICEIDGCGKAFTTASNLRRHNRNVHTKE